MTNVIIGCVFAAITILAVCGGLGMHINGEKGRSLTVGFIVGLIPLLGHLLLALLPATDLHVVDEMYARNLMNAEDYSKTREVLLKK